MKTLFACLTLACFTVAVCTSIPLVISENPEYVKLDSVELIASSPVMDIEENLTIQTFVRVIGKC